MKGCAALSLRWTGWPLVLMLMSWCLLGCGNSMPPSNRAAQSKRPDLPQVSRRAQACPSESMSCHPGCANVGDVHACGQTLVDLAGNLEKAIELIASQEGLSLEDFCKKHDVLCAKGGKQNIDNEYVQQARLLPKGVDPCEWLKEKYREASKADKKEELQKIKRAQKALGCRPNANDF